MMKIMLLIYCYLREWQTFFCFEKYRYCNSKVLQNFECNRKKSGKILNKSVHFQVYFRLKVFIVF